MNTAITWIIAFFVVVVAAFAAFDSVFSTAEERAASAALDASRLINELDTSISLLSGAIVSGSGNSEIDLVVTNDGRRSFSDFDDWTVTVRYEGSGGNPMSDIVPVYASALTDNSWVQQSMWLDYGNSQVELVELGQLNVHEEMVMRIRLSPSTQSNNPVVITVTPPFGTSETIIFES